MTCKHIPHMSITFALYKLLCICTAQGNSSVNVMKITKYRECCHDDVTTSLYFLHDFCGHLTILTQGCLNNITITSNDHHDILIQQFAQADIKTNYRAGPL